MEDWVIRLVDWGGYAGVFLLSLVETLVLPLPSEVILPIAGMRAASGSMELPLVIAASTAGSMTGNMIWYFAARSLDRNRFRFFIDRHGRWLALDMQAVEGIQRLFSRFGSGIVFTGRLLPMIRTLVSIPAGIARMRLASYLVWSTVGTAFFAAALAGGGYIAGAELERVEEIAGPVSSAIILIGLVWYAWRQLTWSHR